MTHLIIPSRILLICILLNYIGVFISFVPKFVYEHVGTSVVVINVIVFHLRWGHRHLFYTTCVRHFIIGRNLPFFKTVDDGVPT